MKKLNKKGFGTDWLFVGSIFLMFIIGGIYYFINSGTVIDKKITYKQVELYSIVDAKDVEGSFILGTGYVNDQLYYCYREVIGEEPLRVRNIKIPYNKYDIVLKDDIKHAYIESKFETVTTKTHLGKLKGQTYLKDEYLVMPKNYVKQEYKIDF